MPLPLSDPVPLRTSAVWPKFAKPETLPAVYGRCTVGAVRYDESRKFWLIADHAIAGVDAVLIDGKPIKAFAWRNGSDPAGHPVALLELAQPLAANASLAVVVRGKVHPETGAMLENPADVLLDVLRLSGHDPEDPAEFRAECAGIAIAGRLSADLTLRAQIAEIAVSVGMLWSPAMPGLARRWPVSTRPTGAPLYARFDDLDLSDVAASAQYDALHTLLRVEYDWDWSRGSARRSVTLRADTATLYGEREATLQAKWLADPASAVARGTSWLEARARPRWSLSLSADLDRPVPPGGWFAIAHPLMPVSGDLLAINAEWDWSQQRQRIAAERSSGPVPAVSIVGYGGLFAEPESGLKITYANGVATLIIADPSGAPIRDAAVTLGNQKAKTDRAGTARFKIARGTYPVTVEASGFSPIAMEITL